MAVTLGFYGAARNVTGSCYLIETAGGRRFLIDCGMYQERHYKERNWTPFVFDPRSIEAVLLTHAHVDHCGLLPKLVRDGFDGPIYCTGATKEIAAIVLLDSGKIQEEDAAYKRKRHEKEGRKGPYPEVPLYTKFDAAAVIPHLTPVEYKESFEVINGVDATFSDAGHILGSGVANLSIRSNGETRTVGFSGDLGRPGTPILRDPATFDQVDYMVVESTYGNRVHEPREEITDRLFSIIEDTRARGGNVVIPSFAVERTQDLLYRLSGLIHEGRLPRIPVYVDGPMAVAVTRVFRRHADLFDAEATRLVEKYGNPCDFPGLTLCRTVAESKAINEVRTPSIIIAGSGMCTGGRIKHHLVNNIEDPRNTILFVGYQANGTLGRHIIEGAESVRIHGEPRAIKARIEKINGFSGHADRNELMAWLSALRSAPRHVYVTHGEPESAEALAEALRTEKGWSVSVPEYRSEEVLQ